MLDQHEVLRTDSFEDARHRYAVENLDLAAQDVQETKRASLFSARAISAPEMQLFCYQNGIDTILTAPKDNTGYWIGIPVVGRRVATGLRVRPAHRSARIASPGARDPLELMAGGQYLGLNFPAAEMARYATDFLGKPVGPIRFDPDFSLNRGVHRAIASLLIAMVEEDDLDPTAMHDPRSRRAFSEAILQLLLMHCAHSETDLVRAPTAAPAPKDVRRVLELIHDTPEEALTLDDLVAVAGVPSRTLNEHFRSFAGVSPMAYLRGLRLQLARDLLLSGQVSTVTEAATATGHWHLGRFAKSYASKFGESPSATLSDRKAQRSD